MADILIQKNLPALTAFFSIAKPNAISTPYYVKKGEDVIPFFGYALSYNPLTLEQKISVIVKLEDGSGNVAIPVSEIDQIYYSSTRFVLSSASNPVPDLIYNYSTITKDLLSAYADPFSEINKGRRISPLIRVNKNTPYKNTDADKDIIKYHLQTKTTYANSLTGSASGNKNLIYFTIFNDPTFVEVLDIFLKSIKNYSDISKFDILILTDDATKTLLSNIEGLVGFNVDYFLLPQVNDPVTASVQKLRIFEYNKLNDYKKVLFLDADIVCFDNISKLFDLNISEDKLNVVEVEGGSPVSPNHSLRYFTDEELEYILQNKVRPFNAGHFMFVNNERMKEHFKNVYWLYNVWPGSYFYEQSFMNYYFNIFIKNTDFTTINQYFQVGLDTKPNGFLTHFIGGSDKVKAMTAYIDNKNICL